MKRRFVATVGILVFLYGCQPSAVPLPGGGSTGPVSNEPGQPEEANFFYFSYDDSASFASRDLSLASIDMGDIPKASWGRPYEFLNAENLGHFNKKTVGPFEVSIGLLETDSAEIPLVDSDVVDTLYSLGVNISGPEISREERNNIVMTLLVDQSWSMHNDYETGDIFSTESRMDLLKKGLREMQASLKEGDIINVVGFTGEAYTIATNVNPLSSYYLDVVNSLNPRFFQSTNITEGLSQAYAVARAHYDPDKDNMVLLLADGFDGVISTIRRIVMQEKVIDNEDGIFFSAVGVGTRFNDAVMDELTEEGKGAYYALLSPADTKRVFVDGFMGFIDHAVSNVRFKLTYPAGWEHLHSAAEEYSTEEEDVSPSHFAYNNDQFFFEIFSSATPPLSDDVLILDIEYEDDSGASVTDSLSVPVSEVAGQGEMQIKTAAAIVTLTQLIAGSLSCDQVQSSGLYYQELDNDLFVAYKHYIDSLCLLLASETG